MMTIAEALAKAHALHRAGQLGQAEELYGAILKVDPCHVDALQLSGMVAFQTGRGDLAVKLMREALRLRPDFAEVHSNLGCVLAEQGKLDEVITHCRLAIQYKPDCALAYNNLGNALQEQGKPAESEAACREAIRLVPSYAQAHNSLGNALRDLGKRQEAVDCYRKAIRLEPEFAEAHNNLGVLLWDLGKPAEAVASYEEAVRLKPGFAKARNNLAIALQALGRPHEAIACCREAIRLRPDYAEAHFNLGQACLQIGDLEEGWAEFEWRWRTKRLDMPAAVASKPLWDAAALGGKTILLHAEQGFGDTLQFIRYAAQVRQRGGRVMLLCPEALVRLLSRCAGIDTLVPSEGPVPPFDVHAPLLSLPRLLGTTSVERIPASVPYVDADPDLVRSWAARLEVARGLRVGIVWQGEPRKWDYQLRAADRRRSFPLAQFEALARLPDVKLVSLQKGFGAEQLTDVSDRFPVIDLGAMLTDFGDTAAVMKNLDLVISADTAPAHLAGALGVPVWVPLAFASCWRWLRQREDSPWYPTMRLFRQRNADNWDEVFARIHAALTAAIRARQTGAISVAEAFEIALKHHKAGQVKPAEQFYRQILTRDPQHADALQMLGVITCQDGRSEDGVGYIRESLRLKPDNAVAQNNLGNALLGQGKLAEAEASYRQALSLRPGFAEAHNNLGNVFKDQNEAEQAKACYREAIRLKPDYVDAHVNLGLACLQTGAFEQGWLEYEWRWRGTGLQMPSVCASRPLWDGSPLGGKTILLHAEQGFGDTLQFIRFAVQVRERGGKVLLYCPEPLVGLMTGCAGIDQVIPSQGPVPPFDVHAPLLSLPRLLGMTSLERIPANVPYVFAERELVRSWRLRLESVRGFRVGIIWQGNPRSWNFQLRAADRRRSFPLAQFEALARIPGVKLVSLQEGFGKEQLLQVADRFAVTDLVTDMSDAAAVMKNLDLVISADTSPVHLAGALGVPVWVPLQFAACWRWLLDREESPWYPTMRLFRQKKADEWEEVFARMKGALEERLQG